LEWGLCFTPFSVIKEYLKNPHKNSPLNSLGHSSPLEKLNFSSKQQNMRQCDVLRFKLSGYLKPVSLLSLYFIENKGLLIIQPFFQKNI